MLKSDATKHLPLSGILPFTRCLIHSAVSKGDMVVDATMGNGIDTLFLAQLVGSSGCVLAYDIQEEALAQTRKRLAQTGNFPQVKLFQKGHQHVNEALSQINQPLAAAMFNLGYLPGGDKSITTLPQSTLSALNCLSSSLKVGGLITLVIYTGHVNGKLEEETLLSELSGWDQSRFDVLTYKFINQQNNPPFLLAIQKKR
jgi:hypothetical protein